MSAAAEIAAALGAKANGHGWTARCICHEDTTPSLSIAEGDGGKVLVKCHAGCEQSALVNALRERGLWPESSDDGLSVAKLATAKGLPESLLRESGFSDDTYKGRAVIRMEYRGADRKIICTRYRGSIEKGGKDQRFWFRPGNKQQLFGLWRLRPEDLILVEGETDTIALWTAGFNAIGVPGAEAWRDSRFADFLKNCPTVYVHVEPDVGGEKFRANFEASKLRDRVRFFTVAPAAKDPCELRARAREAFRPAIEALIRDARPAAKPPAEETRSPDKPAPLLTLLWFASLNEIARQDHLVRDLLLCASLFVVFGESNSGKTFWLLDLCLAIAAGRAWRDRITRKGLVIYVAGEGAASVRMRAAAYRLAHPEIAASLPFAVVPFAVDFLNTESVTTLIATIRAAQSECGEKAVLIVIDTFARSIPGGNENDAQDVGVAVAAADRIRAAIECSVGFVHHAGKDPTKGARGSSALRAAVDTEILIEAQNTHHSATVTKQRDLVAGQVMPFELIPHPVGQHDDGTDITSCVVRQIASETPPECIRDRQSKKRSGKNQTKFEVALKEWARAHPDETHISSVDLRALCKAQSINRQREREVLDTFVNARVLSPAVGGHTLHRDNL